MVAGAVVGGGRGGLRRRGGARVVAGLGRAGVGARGARAGAPPPPPARRLRRARRAGRALAAAPRPRVPPVVRCPAADA